MVDVVIVHHNTLELTNRCIQTLIETAGDTIASIVVVDNASTDGSSEALRAQFPTVRIERSQEPLSYAAACNRGARLGTARYVVLSNSDVEYCPDALGALYRHMESHPRAGVSCPRQHYPSGRPQRSWGYYPGWGEIAAVMLGIEALHNRHGHTGAHWRAVPYCDGAVLFCRRSAYEQLGGMDERFAFFGEDADLCYRMWLHGWHCHFLPSAQVVHHRGATRQRDPNEAIAYEIKNMQAKLRFLQLHHARAFPAMRLGYRAMNLWRRAAIELLRLGTVLSPSDYARKVATLNALRTVLSRHDERL